MPDSFLRSVWRNYSAATGPTTPPRRSTTPWLRAPRPGSARSAANRPGGSRTAVAHATDAVVNVHFCSSCDSTFPDAAGLLAHIAIHQREAEAARSTRTRPPAPLAPLAPPAPPAPPLGGSLQGGGGAESIYNVAGDRESLHGESLHGDRESQHSVYAAPDHHPLVADEDEDDYGVLDASGRASMFDDRAAGVYDNVLSAERGVNLELRQAPCDAGAVPIVTATAEQARLYEEAGGDFKTCKICYTAEKSARISPCSHMACKECLDRWCGLGKQSCPICRGPIMDVTEVVVTHPTPAVPHATPTEPPSEKPEGRPGPEPQVPQLPERQHHWHPTTEVLQLEGLAEGAGPITQTDSDTALPRSCGAGFERRHADTNEDIYRGASFILRAPRVL